MVRVVRLKREREEEGASERSKNQGRKPNQSNNQTINQP